MCVATSVRSGSRCQPSAPSAAAIPEKPQSGCSRSASSVFAGAVMALAGLSSRTRSSWAASPDDPRISLRQIVDLSEDLSEGLRLIGAHRVHIGRLVAELADLIIGDLGPAPASLHHAIGPPVHPLEVVRLV